MNNIYKVIWSKAKNCYVVASEIARSHTKSASGSEKIGGVARHALLALGAACAIACGGFVNVGAAEFVEVQTIGGSNEKVYTKFGTEVYVRDEVEAKLQHELSFYAKFSDTYTKDQVDEKLEALTTTGDVATNKNNINDLKTKAVTTDATLTDLSGRMAVAESDIGTLKADVSTAKSDIGTLKADMTTAKSDIGTLKADVSTAKSDINSLKMKDTELTGKIEAEIANRITSDTALDNKIDAEIANRITSDTALDNKIDAEIANRITSDTALDNKIDTEIQDRKDAIKATNDRTGGIARNLEGTQTTIEGIVKVDNQGNVKDVKNLGAETITTTGNAAIGGALGVTGETTLDGALTAKGEATFKDKVSVEKDLTVDGKLNVGEIYLENNKLDAATGKKHDSATAITADGISNLAKVTDHGHTTESQFTHNEKGTINYAKDGDSTDWTETRSDVTANGVSNQMKDSAGNRHTYSQTATESKEQLVNGDKSNFEKKTAEGNTISIKDKDAAGNDKSLTNKQTVDGEKTSVTNKESSSTINQGADQIRHNVTSADGKKSSIEVKADGITNTSKDGTITNDAKDIVNNATGNMTNTVGGNLSTTVGGNEIHEVKGTKTETVEGKVTENFKNGQATNVTGNQDIHVTGKQTNTVEGGQENIISGGQTNTITGGQINNITGDQTTNVSGTQTTTATDINRNASSSMVDKVDNAYGTNTETKEAGKTTTDVSIKGTGEKGQYIRGANESRDYLIKGTLTNTETKTAEATSSEITDGTNTASTRQDAKNLAGSVTNGTETGISGIHANDDGSVSIDSAVAGGGMSSVINQKKDSIQSAVGDGTNSTVIHQDKDNVTIASSNGTVAIVGKDIVNNASESIINKAKTMDTTVTGKATESYGELETTVNGQATENYKGGLKTDITGEEIHTVTGNQTNKVTGKQTNKIDGNQENTIGGDQTTNVTGDISNTAKNITNAATDTLTDKVGENTRVINGEGITDTVGGSNLKSIVTQKKGSIETVVTDGTSFNHSRDIPVASTKTLTGYGKMNQLLDGLDSSTKTITDGTHKTSKVQTALDITNTAADGTITNAAKDIVNNAQDTITNTAGTKITDTAGDSTVTTENGKGTTFTKTGSTAYREGGPTDTNISGNTITTGKVTMDYADVMRDLGVGGNANIAGTTTTKTLNVTEDASVGRDLSVGGNATITGDVTANSYKVGRNTYIDANGINANNQKITNVADGSISEGSKDAVNGGQLYGVKRDLEHQVDKVGANAAAMANLRPMEFDPSSKWNIAAAIGNYGSETAAALGAFYRPNDNVMVNLSTAFGTGENMVGGGVSVRLGKGGNKLSREETNALKAQVADLSARMDALLSVLNPNMSKDFPDVPENHWAYEAVSRLAGNDIVQGYPDGEFHGERTMTRYEMAEIIYNALSRGAEAERELVEEFKPELQAMAASEKSTAEKAEG